MLGRLETWKDNGLIVTLGHLFQHWTTSVFLLSEVKVIYFNFLVKQLAGSPYSLQQKQGVLTIGLPGMSLMLLFKEVCFYLTQYPEWLSISQPDYILSSNDCLFNGSYVVQLPEQDFSIFQCISTLIKTESEHF